MTTCINQFRIGAATQFVATNDLSVLEIGLPVGFGNYSNFHRQLIAQGRHTPVLTPSVP